MKKKNSLINNRFNDNSTKIYIDKTYNIPYKIKYFTIFCSKSSTTKKNILIITHDNQVFFYYLRKKKLC